MHIAKNSLVFILLLLKSTNQNGLIKTLASQFGWEPAQANVFYQGSSSLPIVK